MGGRRLRAASVEPPVQHAIKLRFVAQALGIKADELRHRFTSSPNGQGMRLFLDPEETRTLRREYGELPWVRGVELVESAAPLIERSMEGETQGPLAVPLAGPAIASTRADAEFSPSPTVSAPPSFRNDIRDLDDPQNCHAATVRLIAGGSPALELLIDELANDVRLPKIKPIILAIGERAIARLMWEFSNPWHRPAVEEILMEFSVSHATRVAQLCVGALQNPEQAPAAKKLLLKLADQNTPAVLNPSCGALRDIRSRSHAADVLRQVGLRHPLPAVNRLLKCLSDPDLYPIATEILIELAFQRPSIDGWFAQWKDTDGFDRRWAIDYIRVMALSFRFELNRIPQ